MMSVISGHDITYSNRANRVAQIMGCVVVTMVPKRLHYRCTVVRHFFALSGVDMNSRRTPQASFSPEYITPRYKKSVPNKYILYI